MLEGHTLLVLNVEVSLVCVPQPVRRDALHPPVNVHELGHVPPPIVIGYQLEIAKYASAPDAKSNRPP
jgi:hypothetical protein